MASIRSLSVPISIEATMNYESLSLTESKVTATIEEGLWDRTMAHNSPRPLLP